MAKEPIWQHRKDAVQRLEIATMIGECEKYDLLGAKYRNAVTRALTTSEVSSRVFNMRQSTMQERWKFLVELCADKPLALGFMQVYNGLRGLALDLEEDHSTLSRNLRSWESRKPPLILTGHNDKAKKNPLVLIHVPFLTQWLLWVAESRASFKSGKPGIIGDETILEIVRSQVPLGLPPPVTNELSLSEAMRLIR